MVTEAPSAALEREHREIDEAIDAFLRNPTEVANRRGLAHAIRELRCHIHLEEEFLFPLLSTTEAALTAPVFVMLREHAQIWSTLDALEHALDADGNADTETSLCRELTTQLLHHNLKEEKVLYPRADVGLTDAAIDKLRSLLGSHVMPDGWVCIKAR